MSVAGSVSSSSTAMHNRNDDPMHQQRQQQQPVTIRDLDATFYVWESLWKRDQNAFVKFNVLDAIIVKTGEIQSWIFTSTDGLVKSKSLHRFNVDGIAERCVGNSFSSGGKLSAHFSSDGFDWNQIRRREQIETFIGNRTQAAMVSYGHIYGNTTWLETTYEIDEAGIKKPKCTTYLLCGSKAMGTALNDDNESIVPNEKIKSRNKDLNECARKVMYDLVRLVEARRNTIQVKCLVAVFMCESEEDIIDGGAGDGSRVLWLHHVREVVFRGKRNKGGNSNGSVSGTASVGDYSQYSDMRSERSERKSLACSDVLHNTSSFSRRTKCTGDFCRYSENEETLIMKSIGTTASSAIAEARRAMQRHGKSAVGDALDEGLEELLAEDDTETPLGADAGTFDSDLVPPVGQARYVPYKSVALARHEMMDLETAQSGGVDFTNSPPQHPSAHHNASSDDSSTKAVSYCNTEKIWPERLRHWWLRIGKSMAQKRTDNVPDSSSSNSTLSITSAAMERTQKKQRVPPARTLAQMHNPDLEERTGPRMVVHMPSPTKSNLSARGIADDERSTNDLSTMGGGSSIASAMSKAVPYDLSENSFAANKRKNLGEVSWYYSDAKVCEKCYRIYQDLDKRRKHNENKLIELRRTATEEMHSSADRLKEQEKREFQQRKFTSRISKVKLKKVEGTDNEYTSFVEHTEVGRRPPNPHTVFGSSGTGTGSGSGSAGVLGIAGRRQGKHKGAVGAPRGMLPPMPWQLKDGDKLQKYQQIGSSFIRNIGSKAREVATDAHHLKMMGELDRVRQAGGGALGALMGSQDDGYETHVDKEWEKLTQGASALRARSEGGNPLQRIPKNQQPRSFTEIDRSLQTTEVKTFDRMRFLHPHQRELEKMRAAERGDEVDPRSGAAVADVGEQGGARIVVTKKKPLSKWESGGGGSSGAKDIRSIAKRDAEGSGMFYKFDDVNRLAASQPDRGPLYPPPAQKTVIQQSQYQRAYQSQEEEEEEGADPSSRVIHLLLNESAASVHNKPNPAKTRGALAATIATSAVHTHGLETTSSNTGKRAVSFGPANTYKIPPVSGGLGALYGHSTPSAGGGPAPQVVGSSGGGGSGAYLVRVPGSLSGPSYDDDDGEDEDDDGEDEGIGWSPFVIPSSK